MEAVWYVAYGSNLASERFRCYLAGGRPAGGARHYSGCRDPRPAQAERAVTMPGGIFFALTSRVWGGGMAFYDRRLPGHTAARAYLLTIEQFADVMSQEMHRDVGHDPDLSEVLATGRQRVGPGRYETVVRVGTAGPDGAMSATGYPMLTFTSGEGAADVPLNSPSAAYLRMLGRGLRESHGWTVARTAAYLAARPGVRGAWPESEIVALLGDEGGASVAR